LTYNDSSSHMARKYEVCGIGAMQQLTVNISNCKRLKLGVVVDIKDTDAVLCQH